MRLDLHGFLAPILGAIGGSLISGIFGNQQAKSNQQAQQNAQNQAEHFNAQQLQQMIDFIKSQQASAFGNLSNYLKQNPNPASTLPPIALPNQINMPSIGGQTIGENGAAMGSPTSAPYTQPNNNSQLLNAILPGLLAQLQPPPAPATPAAPPQQQAQPPAIPPRFHLPTFNQGQRGLM